MMFFMFVFFLPIIKAPSTENIEIGRAFSDGRLSLRWPIYGPRIEAPALSIDEMGHGKWWTGFSWYVLNDGHGEKMTECFFASIIRFFFSVERIDDMSKPDLWVIHPRFFGWRTCILVSGYWMIYIQDPETNPDRNRYVFHFLMFPLMYPSVFGNHNLSHF